MPARRRRPPPRRWWFRTGARSAARSPCWRRGWVPRCAAVWTTRVTRWTACGVRWTRRSGGRSSGGRSGSRRWPAVSTRSRRSPRPRAATRSRSEPTAGFSAARASSSRAGAGACASWTGGWSVLSGTFRWTRRAVAMAAETDRDAGFEARLARLDAIVAALERDDLELEQALALFEEGIQHIRHARELLRQARLRVEQLQVEEDGTVVLEPMVRGESWAGRLPLRAFRRSSPPRPGEWSAPSPRCWLRSSRAGPPRSPTPSATP